MLSFAGINLVGKNIATLTFANCLRRQGIPYQFYAPKEPEPKPFHEYGLPAFVLQARTLNLLNQILGLESTELKRRLYQSHLPQSDEEAGSQHDDRSSTLIDLNRLENLLSQNLDFHAYSSVGHSNIERGRVGPHVDDGNSTSSPFTINGFVEGGKLGERLFQGGYIEHLPFVAVSGNVLCSAVQYEKFLSSREARRGFRSFKVVNRGHTLFMQIWSVPNGEFEYSSLNEKKNILHWRYSRRKYKDDTFWKLNEGVAASSDLYHSIRTELQRTHQLHDSARDSVSNLFQELDFSKSPPFISILKSYLAPREEIDRLAKNGLVFIGPGAYSFPLFWPSFGADAVFSALTDGMKLAEYVFKHGTTQDAIQALYEERYPHWQSSRDKTHELLVDLHKARTSGKDEVPIRKTSSAEYAPHMLRQVIDSNYEFKVHGSSEARDEAFARSLKYGPELNSLADKLKENKAGKAMQGRRLAQEPPQASLDGTSGTKGLVEDQEEGPSFIPAAIAAGYKLKVLSKSSPEASTSSQTLQSQGADDLSSDPPGPEHWYQTPAPQRNRISPSNTSRGPNTKSFRPQLADDGTWQSSRAVTTSWPYSPGPETETQTRRDPSATPVPRLGPSVLLRFVEGNVSPASAEDARQTARHVRARRLSRESGGGEGGAFPPRWVLRRSKIMGMGRGGTN